MAKIEEKVFESELDTGLIRSTCFISMYNSMNKSKVMEGIHFSSAYWPDRRHKELMLLPVF